MLGIWNVGDVGYSGCWKLGGGGGGGGGGVRGGGGWGIRDMECLGCGMSGL